MHFRFWLLFFMLSSASSNAFGKVDVVLPVGYWPPYLYQSGDEVHGLVHDLFKQCINSKVFNLFNKRSSIKRLFDELKTGAYDINVMSYKEKRAKYLHYSSEVLFVDTYVPFYNVNSKIKISNLKDFDKYSIAHVSGLRTSDQYYNYLERRSSRKKNGITFVKDVNVTLRMLVAGRVDTSVNTLATTYHAAKELGVLDQIKHVDFPIRSGEYFLVVSKKSKNILNPEGFIHSFEQCIKRLKKSGEFDRLTKYYHLD